MRVILKYIYDKWNLTFQIMLYVVQSSDQRFLLVSPVINKPFLKGGEFLVQNSFCQLLFIY